MPEYRLLEERTPGAWWPDRPVFSLADISPKDCTAEDWCEVRTFESGRWGEVDLRPGFITVRAGEDGAWRIRVHDIGELDEDRGRVISDAAVTDCLERAVLGHPETELVERGVDRSGLYGNLHYLTFECGGGRGSLAEAILVVADIRDQLWAQVEAVRRDTSRAFSALRDRQFGITDLDAEALLSRLNTAQSANQKGKALEDLMLRLLNSVEGFEGVLRTRSATEEFDIEILNSCADPLWRASGPLVVVECKNRTTKADKNDVVILRDKVKNRRGRCNVGILVSLEGFTSAAIEHERRSSNGDVVVLMLDRAAVSDAVRRGVLSVLNEAYRISLRS